MTHEREDQEGADPGEAVGQLIGELFMGITEVLKSQEAMREVQSVLILRLAEAVISLQIKAGRFADAERLGEAFGMAAAVLNANKENTEGK